MFDETGKFIEDGKPCNIAIQFVVSDKELPYPKERYKKLNITGTLKGFETDFGRYQKRSRR